MSVLLTSVIRTGLGHTGLAAGDVLVSPECFGATASIIGTEGEDVLDGTAGADVIAGLSGDDRISGLSGIDRLGGGSGSNSIAGGETPEPPSDDVLLVNMRRRQVAGKAQDCKPGERMGPVRIAIGS